MPKRVLVVPAGTEIGHEIAESLRYSKHWVAVGANAVRDHSELAFGEVHYNVGFADQPGFAEAVNAIVARHAIDFVVPAHDDAIHALAGRIEGARFVGPDNALAGVLRWKSATIEALADVVPTPTLYPEAGAASFPVFIKPDRGQGSRGARLVKTRHDLESIDLSGVLLQEFLPGPEYTIDCFSNRESEVLFVGPRARGRISGGIATRTETVENPDLDVYAAAISKKLGLSGAWFFQMKLDADGRLKLLEVANRIAGSSGHQRMRGVNLIDAWLHQLDGQAVDFIVPQRTNMICDRALYYKVQRDLPLQCLYVDFDDTLYWITTGEVNHRLVGVLFGLKHNRGVRLVLVTRHGGDIAAKLEELGLGSIFDEIHHLRADEPKSRVITQEHAILIDDSFRERLDVARHCGILCLPPESIDTLEGYLTP